MENKSQEWTDTTETNIREVFELFDKEKSDRIVDDEVGTVMRALGAFPTEKFLSEEVIPECCDESQPGYVAYHKFEKMMLRLLASGELAPDSSDILLQAFRTIDTDNRGNIPADEMEDLLRSKGEILKPKELDAFFSIARDPISGNIYYEDYVVASNNATAVAKQRK